MTGGTDRNDRHERVSTLFARALELPVDERTSFLRTECPDDTSIRDEVLSLLDHDRRELSSLEPAAVRDSLGAVAADSLSGQTPPERIGRYRIVGALGEGGMGVVYEAEQDEPRRRVALKVVHPGSLSRHVLRRFRDEAEILGQLEHPGIARIYDAGAEEGRPYFAMELIDGGPLLAAANRRELDVRQRLELIANVCDAVHHAHQRGVIHRDIKPSNILVDAKGQPKVLDFGVARFGERETVTATHRTVAGQLVGTIPYMSPEQAAGDPGALDIRSDVYSIGVLAFELLSGRLPYDVRDRLMHEAVRIIRENEPSRLSSTDHRLRGDVETIIRKALAKEKSRRYQSAAELAADIRRHLADEPIVARPATMLYQLRKFARRHRVIVGSIAVVALALVAASGVSLFLASVARTAESAANEQRDLAKANLFRATAATIDAVARAYESGDPSAARRLLDSVDPQGRGWEWRHFDARLDASVGGAAPPGLPLAAAWDPAARQLVTIDASGTVTWWNPWTRSAERSVALGVDTIGKAMFAPAATHVVLVVGEAVLVHETSGALVGAAREIGYEPSQVATCAGAERVAIIGRGTPSLWAPGGEPQPLPVPERTQPVVVALSRDGARVALGDASGQVIVHDARTREPLHRLWADVIARVSSVALNDDGTRVAAALVAGGVWTWDLPTERRGPVLHGHEGNVHGIAFGGGRIVTGGGGTIRLWSDAGAPLAIWSGHAGDVASVRLDGGDPYAVSVTTNGETQLWDVELDQTTRLLEGHRSYVYAVEISPDGARIISGAWDGVTAIWDAVTGELIDVIVDLGVHFSSALAPDGVVLATGHRGVVKLHDLEAGVSLPPISSVPREVIDLEFSPDGSRLAGCTSARKLFVWDWRSGSVLVQIPTPGASHAGVAWSPDGERLAMSIGLNVHVLDADTGAVVLELHGQEVTMPSVDYSPDGALIAAGGVDGQVRVWDAATGRPVAVLGTGATVWRVLFSPDGDRLASGSDDGLIRIWDVEHGLAATLAGHESYVYDLAYTPDGAVLVSASGDRTLRVRDTRPDHTRWSTRALRRQQREGLQPFVEQLYETHGSRVDVVEAIRADEDLPAWQRDAAVQLAQMASARSAVQCDPFDGAAIELDGVSQSIRIGDDPRLRLTDRLTIEAWIQPAVAAMLGRHETIINKEGEYQIAIQTDGRVAWTLATDELNWHWVPTGFGPSPGVWSHIALTYGDGDARFYVDGVLTHVRVCSGPIGDAHPGQDELRLGDRQRGALPFAGRLDEVRIWSVVRSADEISAGMHAHVAPDAPGLIAAWRLDEGDGGVVADDTGRFDGRLVGAEWVKSQKCEE